MEHVLKHIDHVVSVAGVEHVGSGTDVDLDGRGQKFDLDGSSYSDKIYEVTEGLVRRKYSPGRYLKLSWSAISGRALGEIWSAV